MTPDEKALIAQLRDQYNSINDSLHELLAACNTLQQRVQIGNAMQTALMTYITAQNSVLGQDSQLIQQASVRAAQAQQSINQALQSLQNIAVVISTITTAVSDVATVVGAL